jgi:5-methylcytosine-specific restriction endonuclease McrA
MRARHAAVWRRFPFTIILRDAPDDATPQLLRLKIDPGSNTTGLALVVDATGQVAWAGELTHRGQKIKKNLARRRACRRSRRNRHTRYRPARFRNRRRREGWLAPSLESRIANVVTWVRRLVRICPIGALSLELVRFDTQLLQNPEISGIEYQQGELAGYEVREFVLEKWGRRCAYCSATGVPLQIEHVRPKSRGGTDRVSNLTLACERCNQKKGTRTAAEFGHPEVEAQAKRPLRDAAAVNTTRWVLWHRLETFRLPLETGTGGRTKWNRTVRGLPKAHWTDAACVGASTPAVLGMQGIVPLLIRAQGRHSRQMCRTNGAGFPNKGPKATSVVGGLRTGDIVHARVPARSVKAGTYVGRLAVRASGSCDIRTATGAIHNINVRYCHPIHRSDGYSYQKGEALPPRPEG